MPAETKKYEPRSYQMELFQACKDKNMILVAPTGSGKTLVATMLIEKFLKESEKIIVFLAPQVPLLKQQCDYVKDLLPKEYEAKITIYHGTKWNPNKKWAQLIKECRVIFFTPQLFVNILQQNENSLQDVSLLIFDECHNARKEHPYRKLLVEYYHPIYNMKSELVTPPQILGLSASPAAQSTVAETIINLVQTCQDYKSYMSIVRESLLDMVDATNVVQATPIDVQMDEKSFKFHTKTFDAAANVKTRLKNSQQYSNKNEITLYSRLLCCLHETLWINDGRSALEAWHFLWDYLEKNPDSAERLKELDYTRNSFNESNLPTDSVKRQTMFMVLHNLSQKLGEKFKCLILVKTRNDAAAMVDYLQQRGMDAEMLVGQSDPKRYGMTPKKQIDALNSFKTKSKIMIATSVAEEGLDVVSCNLVIRMHNVKTALEFIQCRGRARALDNAVFCVINHEQTKQLDNIEAFALQEFVMNKAAGLLSQIESEMPKLLSLSTPKLTDAAFEKIYDLSLDYQHYDLASAQEQFEVLKDVVEKSEAVQLLTLTSQKLLCRDPQYDYAGDTSIAHEPKYSGIVQLSKNRVFDTSTIDPKDKTSNIKPTYPSKQAAKKAVTEMAVDELFKRDLLVIPSSKPASTAKPAANTSTLSNLVPKNVQLPPLPSQPVKKIPPNSTTVSEILNEENAVNILMHIAQTEGLKADFSFSKLGEQLFDCCAKMGEFQIISDSHSNKQAAKKQAACGLLGSHYGSYFVPKSFAR